MLSLSARRRLTLGVLVGVPALALVGLGWFAWQSPSSRFLPPDPAAEWIRYPVPPQVVLTSARVERHALFRRTFEIEAVPPSAPMYVRAFRTCSVRLNGRPIDLPGATAWNRARTCDVASNLRAGTNDLLVEVANDVGPPLLWLCLEGPDGLVATDGRWQATLDGAAERPATPAGEYAPPRPGNPAAGGDRAWDSLRHRWPTLLLFALLSAIVLALARFVPTGQRAAELFGHALSPTAACLVGIGVLWLLLFGNNTWRAPLFPAGFDHTEHLEYVRYIQEYKALPLADEGWEMYQPPLYYLLAAGLLGTFGLSTSDPGALAALRLLGLAIGLAQLALVAGCLRLLFPGRPRAQIAGVVLAGFLPVHIYLCHYITNEALLTTLATAAIYLALLALRDERPTAGRHALLGLALGAALLTKITAVVVVGVVLLVLAGRLLARRERRPGDWLRGPGAVLLVTVVVCGWHYARVWARFGTPLVGNFDPASGFVFWQDPGYGTVTYLVGFGRSLVAPFYSAFHGLPDGVYSTLWGDGLLGGAATWRDRPPWNYGLMAAGYLLALVPTLLIGVGLVAAVVGLVRRPSAEWFLLLGVAGGLAVALLYQFVRYPYHGHAKAMYVLSGMATLCACGAWGADLLARLGRVPAALLAVLLGTWACTAYASFWIAPYGAVAQNWAGLQQFGLKRRAEAERSFRKAIEADPHFAEARLHEAGILSRKGEARGALRLTEEVLRDDPDNAEALLVRASVLDSSGRADEALADVRKVTAVAPDHPIAYFVLGGMLMRQGRPEEAATAYRQAIRVWPSSPADHANLGLLLARAGRTEEAIAQYRIALDLRPDAPGLRADLAWLLATSRDQRFRDPEQSLRLAEEACQGTRFRDLVSLQALAAAHAAGGHFDRALEVLRMASEIAAGSGRKDLIARVAEQMRSYEKRQPFYSPAPLREGPYPPTDPRKLNQ